MNHLLLAATAAAALAAAAPAAAAVITSLPGGTVLAMQEVNYRGIGPQTVSPGVTWSSTSANSNFGFSGWYGLSANGSWTGLPPYVGLNTSSGTMTFAFDIPVAAVAGTDGTDGCRPGRPVPVFHLHARDDDRVLFNGGSGSASDTHADFVSVPATVDKWARLTACSGPTQTVLQRPGVTCEVRSGCAGGAELRLCVTDSGGHSWPGGRKALGGRGSTALDATEAIWEFFARQ